MTWFYMQTAGSSINDIVAHDLQQIPRVLATIRSLMCMGTSDTTKGHRSEDPCLHTCTCSHYQRTWQERMGHAEQHILWGRDGQKLLDIARIL